MCVVAANSMRVGTSDSGKLIKVLKRQKMLHLFVLLGITFLFIFNYIPMAGVVMAFKDYSITMGFSGIFTSEWAGFKHFSAFVNDFQFWQLIRNTLVLSVLKLLFVFPMPIVFAIMLNEVRHDKFKRAIQTVSYLPHFISWVIVSGFAISFLGTDMGVINDALALIGLQRVPFLTSANTFWPVAVVLDVWKDMGWWTIIFLAAITGIDQTLYEAADMDGATRFQKIGHITLPGIQGTVAVVLILALGNLFGGGLSNSNFEQSYLLGNPTNMDTAEIIQTYVFRVGLANGRYAYATAVGLVQSAISLVLIFTSNFLSKKFSGSSLF